MSPPEGFLSACSPSVSSPCAAALSPLLSSAVSRPASGADSTAMRSRGAPPSPFSKVREAIQNPNTTITAGRRPRLSHSTVGTTLTPSAFMKGVRERASESKEQQATLAAALHRSRPVATAAESVEYGVGGLVG